MVQWPLCLALLAEKKIDLMPMITHRQPFSAEGVAKGFDIASRAAETGAVKVMFNF